VSRPVVGPTKSVQLWVLRTLSYRVKRLIRAAKHMPPASAGEYVQHMAKPPLRYTLVLAWCLILKHEALLVFNYCRERQDRTFLRLDWRQKVMDRACITDGIGDKRI